MTFLAIYYILTINQWQQSFNCRNHECWIFWCGSCLFQLLVGENFWTIEACWKYINIVKSRAHQFKFLSPLVNRSETLLTAFNFSFLVSRQICSFSFFFITLLTQIYRPCFFLLGIMKIKVFIAIRRLSRIKDFLAYVQQLIYCLYFYCRSNSFLSHCDKKQSPGGVL